MILLNSFRKLVLVTKLSHTLFALPLIIAVAWMHPLCSLRAYLFVLIAFISARSAGLSFNQWLDAPIDRHNPRTESRALPKGLISAKETLTICSLFLILFLIICSCWSLYLTCMAFVAAGLILIYSFLKRVSFLSHFCIGLIYGLSILMTWSALGGTPPSSIYVLAAVAFCLISANDMIYALADEEFDKKYGLYSVPACFGKKITLCTTVVLHVAMLWLWWILKSMLGLNSWFYIPWFISYCVLITLYLLHEKYPFVFACSTASISLCIWISVCCA